MRDETYFKNNIASIEGFPKEGIIFRDITPTLENKEAFNECINAYIELASKWNFDKVICADARGFIFGAPVAYKMNKGLIMARKPNKLPRPGKSFNYSLEYGTNTLVISEGSIKEGERILIVDDLLATGGSAFALANLVKECKGIPVGAIFYIELVDLKGRDLIKQISDIEVDSIVKYHGE